MMDMFNMSKIRNICLLPEDLDMLEDPRTPTLRRISYGIVLPTICCFGIIGNILNLVVLTRRNMRGTAYIYMRDKRTCSVPVSTYQYGGWSIKIPTASDIRAKNYHLDVTAVTSLDMPEEGKKGRRKSLRAQCDPYLCLYLLKIKRFIYSYYVTEFNQRGDIGVYFRETRKERVGTPGQEFDLLDSRKDQQET
ncbi:Probable G-protein coupled receptor B0563.6 [Camponotus floridanus]|uniref:Probable G-protein coupled receptor B0563.6 n=1 Tax=Camponotus floridanus TaxID=104421 RepID=E2AKS9_CAMFO|nr:Probable G-protein coupled receptor B0563.6 [Camponotus floridanus]